LNLNIKGIGVFPSIKNARVVWAGLGGETTALLNFQRHLDVHLAEKGFRKEKRSFKAHLTLGRMNRKIDPARLLNAMSMLGEFEPESFSTHRIVLFKSDLKPTGAVYTPLYVNNLI
jgi:2'-5' RNA ligase